MYSERNNNLLLSVDVFLDEIVSQRNVMLKHQHRLVYQVLLKLRNRAISEIPMNATRSEQQLIAEETRIGYRRLHVSGNDHMWIVMDGAAQIMNEG